jgi:hypothetical protein
MSWILTSWLAEILLCIYELLDTSYLLSLVALAKASKRYYTLISPLLYRIIKVGRLPDDILSYVYIDTVSVNNYVRYTEPIKLDLVYQLISYLAQF